MLENKTMLVTGGSRGIGAQIVRRAMEEGAQVAFTYKGSTEIAARLSQELTALYSGQTCTAYQCDVADTDAMQSLVATVLQELGHLDVLVNNAGITRDVMLVRRCAASPSRC